jgi:hypothetical protein
MSGDILCLLGEMGENISPVRAFSFPQQQCNPIQHLFQLLDAPLLDFLDHVLMMAEMNQKIENKVWME